MDEQKFEGLAQLVGEVDGDGPATPEQTEALQAETAALDSAQQWASVLQMAGAALSMLAPELRQVYTPAACEAWGQAMQPVAEKYGWNSPANAPEFGLALASLGVGVPTYMAIKRRLDMMKAEREKPRAVGAPATAPAGMDGAYVPPHQAPGDGC